MLNASTVTYGLNLATNDSVIAGLVVRSAAGNLPVGATCANDGICVTGNHNLIRGNYVGTNHTGLVAQGNGGDGIQIVGDGNVVGAPIRDTAMSSPPTTKTAWTWKATTTSCRAI